MMKKSQRGFTLQEMLVAIAIISILSVAVYLIFWGGRNFFTLQNYTEVAENQVLKASLIMQRELREARAPEGLNLSAIEEATPQSIIFYADITQEPVNNKEEKVQYRLYNGRLLRGVAYWNISTNSYDPLPDLTQMSVIEPNPSNFVASLLANASICGKAKAQPPGPPGTKIDLLSIYNSDNSAVSASTQALSSIKVNTIDGNINTQWGWASTNDWWKIDLKNTYDISKVRWANATSDGGPFCFSIQASTDGNNWTTIACSIVTEIWMEQTVDPTVSARYIRLFHPGHPLGWHLIIGELELYTTSVVGDVCGDTLCTGTETCSTCSQDCGSCDGDGDTCGDGSCTGSETCSTCPQDCGNCGGGNGHTGSSVICQYVVNGANPIFYYYDQNYTGSQQPMSYPINLGAIRVVKTHFEVDPNPGRAPESYTHDLTIKLRNLGV